MVLTGTLVSDFGVLSPLAAVTLPGSVRTPTAAGPSGAVEIHYKYLAECI